MGRPKAAIDWEDVGEMLKCGCDATSIASALGISTDTLYTRSKRDNKLDFSAFSQQKRALGNDLLRRKQFELALNGSVSMLIWLGKTRLGQSERQVVDAKVSPGDPIEWMMRIFIHAKKLFVALELSEKGVAFDANNSEHREGVKRSIARLMQSQKRIYPDDEEIYVGWEDKYEQVKEIVWNFR